MTTAQRIHLYVLVFGTGLVILGVELAASRLMAPFFGTSIIVWSSLIALILAALSVGYWVGGNWADRCPVFTVLLHIALAGAVAVILIPFASRPILRYSLLGFADQSLGVLAGSFIGSLVLLGGPMVLLGCIMPFAVRLATSRVEEAGQVAGRLFALSTVGSFIGAFVPSVWLIPAIGTLRTYLVLGVFMLVILGVGYGLVKKYGFCAGCLVAAAALGGWVLLCPAGSIKGDTHTLEERESVYQYLRVVEDEQGWRKLEVNEGIVSHSKYHPSFPFTYGQWDYLPLAPYFNPAPFDPYTKARKWAIIGAGAGTSARLINRLYGDVDITGVEIDRVVVDLGRKYFDADFPGYQVDVSDGRRWLHQSRERYDVIAIDAYRQPYIPFELSTVEFFQEVMKHLSPHGVVVMNVARPSDDQRLVNALATTLEQVFPSIFLVHLRDTSSATILVGTVQPATEADFRENAKAARGLAVPLLHRAGEALTSSYPPGIVLTDDRAPVERLMDLMIFREMAKRGS